MKCKPANQSPGSFESPARSARLSPVQFGFTRTEALCLLAVLSLLLAIVLPALANDRNRSSRIVCANNLRQIGLGYQLWGNDHGDLPPWEVRVDQGGTMLQPLGVNAWLHFSWISNELSSARILFCPSDTGRAADDFTNRPDRGYLHASARNNATSYYLSHSSAGGQWVMFAGDRNFITLGGVGSCSRFPQAAFAPLPNLPGWDTNLHNAAGNLARFDGRVNQYSNDELRPAIAADPLDDRGILHILKPR